MFSLICSLLLQLSIGLDFWADTADAVDSGTFDIANDQYCFCDLYKSVSDLNCCCDSLKDNVDSNNCLVGSLKELCIKKYIIYSQNVDQWVNVRNSIAENKLCIIYDANQAASTIVETYTDTNMDFYQDSILRRYIPQYKYMTSNQRMVNSSWLQHPISQYILYPNSFGICSLVKQMITHQEMPTLQCAYIPGTACSDSNTLLKESITPTYKRVAQQTTYEASSATGCVSAVEYSISYNTLITTISTAVLNSIYSINKILYTDTTNLQSVRTVDVSVLYKSSITNLYYSGQKGYRNGQPLIGKLSSASSTSNYKIYKGKDLYSIGCQATTSNIVDPLMVEYIEFGKNVQFSCRSQLSTSTCSTDVYNTFQLFQSFGIGDATFQMGRFPYNSTDLVSSSQVSGPSVTSTETSCTISSTQEILIYYNQYGDLGSRQNYISQISSGFKNNEVIAIDDYIYFKVQIRFINLAFDEIQNDLPPRPSFIPQLPGDIFFPIWYDSYGVLISFLIIIILN